MLVILKAYPFFLKMELIMKDWGGQLKIVLDESFEMVSGKKRFPCLMILAHPIRTGKKLQCWLYPMLWLMATLKLSIKL